MSNALSKSFGSSDASTSRAISWKRLKRSTSVSLGLRSVLRDFRVMDSTIAYRARKAQVGLVVVSLILLFPFGVFWVNPFQIGMRIDVVATSFWRVTNAQNEGKMAFSPPDVFISESAINNRFLESSANRPHTNNLLLHRRDFVDESLPIIIGIEILRFLGEVAKIANLKRERLHTRRGFSIVAKVELELWRLFLGYTAAANQISSLDYFVSFYSRSDLINAEDRQNDRGTCQPFCEYSQLAGIGSKQAVVYFFVAAGALLCFGGLTCIDRDRVILGRAMIGFAIFLLFYCTFAARSPYVTK